MRFLNKSSVLLLGAITGLGGASNSLSTEGCDSVVNLEELPAALANQCKADLIVKEFEREQEAYALRVSLGRMMMDEAWLSSSLASALGAVNFTAERLVKGLDLPEPARQRAEQGIEEVRAATEKKIRATFGIHINAVKLKGLENDVTSSVLMFTNKEQSEDFLDTKLPAVVKEIKAMGLEPNQDWLLETKKEMERRADRVVTTEEERQAKTWEYVLNANRNLWVHVLERHKKDKSVEDLNADWDQLGSFINDEICTRMISPRPCTKYLEEELHIVYEQTLNEIKQKV